MGDIESLKDMLKFNREQESVKQEALENDECPYCAWTLKTNSKGDKSCPICGRSFK